MIDGDEMVTLTDLSAAVDLSTYHLQRSFKEIDRRESRKICGGKENGKVSRKGLRDGSDVTTAMYDAGFDRAAALYEKASENLGMTPATYKKGGQGMKISYAITDCELGSYLVARTKRGICSVTFGDGRGALCARDWKGISQRGDRRGRRRI